VNPSAQLYTEPAEGEDDPCTYFCGHGIGLQPRGMAEDVQHYMDRWATQGYFAGFAPIADSKALPWGEVETEAVSRMAKIVGAKESETVLMAGLTISLHLLMASFYRPEGQKTKIIVERGSFSSDFVSKFSFAVEEKRRG
jgi:kynureninase